jgi:hypothetical protein
MRKVVRVTAVAAAGLVLLACNRPPPPPREAVYAPPPAQTYGNGFYAHVAIPPALPPRTYGGAPYGRADVPPQIPPAPPPQASGDASYGRADVPQQEQRLVWKSSPRWATIKSNAKREAGTGTANQDAQSKLKLAQAKAEKIGVENLTSEDIAGLTAEQLKLLRGY